MTPTQKEIVDKIRSWTNTSRHGMTAAIIREDFIDKGIVDWFFEMSLEYDDGRQTKYFQCHYHIGKRGSISYRDRFNEVYDWSEEKHRPKDNIPSPYLALR